MIINGIEVPDEFANDVAMREAFLASHKPTPTPEPAPEPTPEPAPTPAPTPNPDPSPAPAPTVSYTEAQYNELRGQLDAKEKAIEELSKKASMPNKINDPDLYRLAVIKEKSPEKFSTFASLKISNSISHIDLLVDDYISKNPEYKDQRDKVSSFLRNSYGLDKEIPDPLDPETDSEEDVSSRNLAISEAMKQREFSEMRMKSDAKSILSRLEEEFNAIELPETTIKTPEQINEEKIQAKSNWTPIVDKIFESLKAVPVFTQEKDAKEPTEFMSYAIPEDLIPEYKKQVLGFCVESGIPLTQEGVSQAAAVFVSSFKREHEARIMNEVVKRARKLSDQEYDAMYSNPSQLKDQQRVDNAPIETPYEKSVRLTLEAEGIKR